MAAEKPVSGQGEGASRRDFLYVATAGVSAVGVGLAAWPFVDTMNPSADVLALSSIELDLSPIEVGQSITVLWRKKPVFVRRRTAEEIAAAQADDGAELPDPQTDTARAPNPEWLILQAPMGDVSTPALAAAVSNAGGLGGITANDGR